MIPTLLRRSAVAATIAVVSTAPSLGAQAVSADTAILPATAGSSVQFGSVGLQSGAFNAQLAAQGRGQLDKNMLTIGVQSWVRWDRLMVLAGSHTYLPTRAAATNYTTETKGAYGTLDVGIPIIIQRKTLVYPLAGLGLSTSTVTLRRNGDVDFNDDFRDIPSDGGRNIDITARRYQAHIGAGLDRVFTPPWPKLLLMVGLRAGYMTPIGDPNWRSGPERVNGAPELGLKGAYARLTFGGVLIRRRFATVPMIGSLLPYLLR